MQAILQERYDRVERALDTLIDSVTAYNPSLNAADELVTADEDVNESLEQRVYPYLVRPQGQHNRRLTV